MKQGALERRVMRKLAWRLLPFMVICYVAAYLDRVNVSFAKQWSLLPPEVRSAKREI